MFDNLVDKTFVAFYLIKIDISKKGNRYINLYTTIAKPIFEKEREKAVIEAMKIVNKDVQLVDIDELEQSKVKILLKQWGG